MTPGGRPNTPSYGYYNDGQQGAGTLTATDAGGGGSGSRPTTAESFSRLYALFGSAGAYGLSLPPQVQRSTSSFAPAAATAAAAGGRGQQQQAARSQNHQPMLSLHLMGPAAGGYDESGGSEEDATSDVSGVGGALLTPAVPVAAEEIYDGGGFAATPVAPSEQTMEVDAEDEATMVDHSHLPTAATYPVYSRPGGGSSSTGTTPARPYAPTQQQQAAPSTANGSGGTAAIWLPDGAHLSAVYVPTHHHLSSSGGGGYGGGGEGYERGSHSQPESASAGMQTTTAAAAPPPPPTAADSAADVIIVTTSGGTPGRPPATAAAAAIAPYSPAAAAVGLPASASGGTGSALLMNSPGLRLSLDLEQLMMSGGGQPASATMATVTSQEQTGGTSSLRIGLMQPLQLPGAGSGANTTSPDSLILSSSGSGNLHNTSTHYHPLGPLTGGLLISIHRGHSGGGGGGSSATNGASPDSFASETSAATGGSLGGGRSIGIGLTPLAMSSSLAYRAPSSFAAAAAEAAGTGVGASGATGSPEGLLSFMTHQPSPSPGNGSAGASATMPHQQQQAQALTSPGGGPLSQHHLQSALAQMMSLATTRAAQTSPMYSLELTSGGGGGNSYSSGGGGGFTVLHFGGCPPALAARATPAAAAPSAAAASSVVAPKPTASAVAGAAPSATVAGTEPVTSMASTAAAATAGGMPSSLLQ